MIDAILTVIVLVAGNAAFWLLILKRRARRYLVKGWVARYGASSSAKEDIATGDVVVLCVAIVFEMAFILLTIAAAHELLSK